MPASDRRATERVPIELWIEEHQGESVVLHPAANLSEGGVFLYADRLRPGDECDLAFALPDDGQGVNVRARVVWETRAEAAPHGVGVEFLDLDEDDRAAISHWVAHAR
jgi:uncharacterized protein (TIGR02266 family)